MTDVLRLASRWRSAFAIVALVVLTLPNAIAGPIETHSGLVEGIEDNGSLVFKGIPFAAPPVGPLRWRGPGPPAAWTGVRKADRFSPICMQKGAYPEDSPPEPMSEDCLYLNIWAPAGARDVRLPVMVWIYGGGLLNGSASTPLYAGDVLARRGVIVVTFNYRLGALGFLAHPELTRESPQKVSGNYGLLDQVAAMQWVKRNIAAFGGDPDNITVFGQSSGSISISALGASPLAKGLYRRAIGQSGGLFEPLDAAPEFKLDGAEQVGSALGRRLGAASLEALRALPAAKFVEKHYPAQPNIDGYVLTQTPYAIYADRRQHDADLLVGSNGAEGLYFLGGRNITAANLLIELKRDFPPFIVSLVGPEPTSDDQQARAGFIALEGDMRFGWNMWAWARLHASARKGRTYLYHFAPARPGEEGASHGAEMPYVFGHPGPKSGTWTKADHRLAETMAAYWTNFAKTGNPNGDGLPVWPEANASGNPALLIGDDVRAGELPNESNLKKIDRLYATARFVLNYWPVIAGVVGLAVLFLGWQLARIVLRRRRART